MVQALPPRPLSWSLTLAALLGTPVVAGCGSDGGGASDVAATDATASDAATAADTADTGPADAGDEAPWFVVPPPITLTMGERTTLDLKPLLSDAEDDDASLAVTWTALHVALADPGDHVLAIIAPVDWSGVEAVGLAATDSAGHVARQTLTVTVVPPEHPVEPLAGCAVTFSIAAGKSATQVFVSGAFNGWASTAETADALTDADGDGVWTAELELDPGVWPYKFVVDGAWVADPANPRTTDDGYGGTNSVREIAADCSEPAPCGLTTFTYAAAPAVASVFVAGSFNGWSATANPLADADRDHTFEAALVLAPGHHEYKLVVDGGWITDPTNEVTADDGFGGKNSVLEITCPAGGADR